MERSPPPKLAQMDDDRDEQEVMPTKESKQQHNTNNQKY
jgi:hypothetical protein